MSSSILYVVSALVWPCQAGINLSTLALMKNTASRLALLRSRFRALNASGHIAVASLAAFAASRQIDAKDHARRVKSLVTQTAAEMDNETRDERDTGETLSPALASLVHEVAAESDESSALNLAERRQLAHERPGARSIVFRAALVAVSDEPLPEGFTPSPVEDFAPVASRELIAQVDAEIAGEAAFLAAVAALPLRLNA